MARRRRRILKPVARKKFKRTTPIQPQAEAAAGLVGVTRKTPSRKAQTPYTRERAMVVVVHDVENMLRLKYPGLKKPTVAQVAKVAKANVAKGRSNIFNNYTALLKLQGVTPPTFSEHVTGSWLPKKKAARKAKMKRTAKKTARSRSKGK